MPVARSDGTPVARQPRTETLTRQEDFGRRLRSLRLERGLTQAQLAGPDLSTSFISLLEAGKRSATSAVLERLADRLGCDQRLLADGVSEADATELELQLRYAELALNSGEATEAVNRFRAVLERDPGTTLAKARGAARWGLARALEAAGDVEAAIGLYEAIREEAESAPNRSPWLPAVMALCGCYLEVGDLHRSVELGESARSRLAELGLQGTDAEVELLSTLVGGYHARGDLVRARLLAEQTVARAERLGSRRARGAAYWNASLVSHGLGRSAEALGLAERALALYAEGDDGRSLGRLRTAYAWLLLQQRPPQPEAAEALLVTALATLAEVGTEVDLAYCETELARTRLALGRPDDAIVLAGSSLRRLGNGRRLEAARARLVYGGASLALGDSAAALVSYRRAAEDLSSIGATREAAVGWRELADALSQLGRDHEALDAYRHAADAVGLAGSAVPTPAAPVVHQLLASRT